MPRVRSILVAAFAWCAAAHGALAADVVYPAASRIGIVPPPDFVVSNSFVGFTHTEKQARIVIGELPGYVFDTLVQQADQQKGREGRREDVTLADGKPAILFSGIEDSAQGPILKWTLLAQRDQVSALVGAGVHEAVKDAAPPEAMRAALLSTNIRERVPNEELLSVLPFSLNDLAQFRIVRVHPGSAAMLTDGPKDAVEPVEQPLLIISIGPMQTPPGTNERDSVARRMFSELPGIKDVRIVRAEPLRVAGAQGYEIVAEGKDMASDTDINAVQWVRFGTGTIMRIVGVARKDAWDKDFGRFRAVRDGVGPR